MSLGMMIVLTVLTLCLCTRTLAGELFERQANSRNTKAPGATIRADPFQQEGLCRRWAHQSTKSSCPVSEFIFLTIYRHR